MTIRHVLSFLFLLLLITTADGLGRSRYKKAPKARTQSEFHWVMALTTILPDAFDGDFELFGGGSDPGFWAEARTVDGASPGDQAVVCSTVGNPCGTSPAAIPASGAQLLWFGRLAENGLEDREVSTLTTQPAFGLTFPTDAPDSVATMRFKIRQVACDTTNKNPDNFTISLNGAVQYSEDHQTNAGLGRCAESTYRTVTIDISSVLPNFGDPDAVYNDFEIKSETTFQESRTTWWMDDLEIFVDSPAYMTGSTPTDSSSVAVYPNNIVLDFDESFTLVGEITVSDGTNTVTLGSANVGAGQAITVTGDATSGQIDIDTTHADLNSINRCAASHTVTVKANALQDAESNLHTAVYTVAFDIILLEVTQESIAAAPLANDAAKCAVENFGAVEIQFNTDVEFVPEANSNNGPVFSFGDGIRAWQLPTCGGCPLTGKVTADNTGTPKIQFSDTSGLTGFNGVDGAYSFTIPAGEIRATANQCPTTAAITFTWGQPNLGTFPATTKCAHAREDPLVITTLAPVQGKAGGIFSIQDGAGGSPPHKIDVGIGHSSISISGTTIEIDLADDIYEDLLDTADWLFTIEANTLELTTTQCDNAGAIGPETITILAPPAWDKTDNTFDPFHPDDVQAVFQRASATLKYTTNIAFSDTAVITLISDKATVYLVPPHDALSINLNALHIDFTKVEGINLDESVTTVLEVAKGSIQDVVTLCAQNYNETLKLNSTCGDGELNSAEGEACDIGVGAGSSCIGEGYAGGSLVCASDCSSLNVGSCTAHIGVGGHDSNGLLIDEMGKTVRTWFNMHVPSDAEGSYAGYFCGGGSCPDITTTGAVGMRPYPNPSDAWYLNSNVWRLTGREVTGEPTLVNWGESDETPFTPFIFPDPAENDPSAIVEAGLFAFLEGGDTTLGFVPGDILAGTPGQSMLNPGALWFRISNTLNQVITGFELRFNIQSYSHKTTTTTVKVWHGAPGDKLRELTSIEYESNANTNAAWEKHEYMRIFVTHGVAIQPKSYGYLMFEIECVGCADVPPGPAPTSHGDAVRIWNVDYTPYISRSGDWSWDKAAPGENNLKITGYNIKGSDSWTIEAWVFPIQYEHGVVPPTAVGDMVLAGGWNSFAALTSLGNLTYIALPWEGGQKYWTIEVHNSALASVTFPNAKLWPEKWQHVAITFQTAASTLWGDYLVYVDGELKGTAEGQPGPEWGGMGYGDFICVGHQNCTTDGMGFTGLIDEFRIWNKALTAEDISTYKDVSPTLTPAEGLQVHLQFNEATTSNAGSVTVEALDTVTLKYSSLTPLVISAFAGGTLSCEDTFVKTGGTVTCTVTIADSSGDPQAAPNTAYITIQLAGDGSIGPLSWTDDLTQASFTYTAPPADTGTDVLRAYGGNTPFGSVVRIRTISEGCQGCEFRSEAGPGCDGLNPPPCIDAANTFPPGCCNKYYSCDVSGVAFLKRNIKPVAGTCPA
eukprot:TRINITY_DN62252_c0_g1_i1.p1 TRINITY_DN62252_c0_g1~~TRINITY_DN62252_c0_g1_i1.p1  ORF type:complete len:1455 (-),score=177.26 TRINITY_DN62252_c0_g1_i1:300-4664(-)